MSSSNVTDKVMDDHCLPDFVSTKFITYDLLNRCSRSLKCGKARGPDELTAEHLLHAHPLIISHSCLLFRSIIAQSFVPDEFGIGTIVPLIKDKSGDLNSVDNYRSIT